MSNITEKEALEALNELRSNVVATQTAGWSNTMYPLVAILDAAGLQVFDPTEDQMASHIDCYGGAGGYPGKELREPSDSDRITVRNLLRRKERESKL